MWLILLATVLSCANSQNVKTANYGVKGGYGGHGYQYNAQEAVDRFYGNSTQQHDYGYNGGNNYSPQLSLVGVCFIEVPTASLVRDPAHVPAGNGSRPDLSRIQSCCSGYIRNIHNHQLCDPVCTQECTNALCTAPETCTCFPDHVKNAAGFCVPTCPIGCQNGQCAGGECLCKDGYTLDSNGKYCMPRCDNCGGVGNCTAPNTCTCKPGYQSTPEGSCRITCDKPCDNGDCVAPNECRCRPGYTKDQQGQCVPHCAQSCGPSGRCVSPNVCSNHATSTPVSHPNQASPPPYNQHYPGYPQQPTNYSSNHPHSPDNLRPYNSNHGHQQPYYPDNNSPYYPTDNLNRPTYNITSDSQVRPNSPGNQTSYGPGSNYPSNPIYQPYPGPNGQPYPSYPSNQTGYYPSGPYNSPPGLNNTDANHRPTNQHYYPYYPDQSNSMSSPGNPNQPGYYPGQPNQPGYSPNQPGNQTSYQPNPSGYYPYQPTNYHNQPNQTGYQPNQPYQPGYQPGYQPNQPGYHPNQPNQPGYQPNQPSQGYQPNQPGFQPNQPHSPYQPGQPNSNSTNPYGALYPQLPNYPYSYDQTGNGMIPQCSEPCINGICVEGRCSCNSGYVLDNTDPTGSRCIPHCPGGCNNGVCSAPNFCICNVGYRKEQGVKGRSGCVKRIR